MSPEEMAEERTELYGAIELQQILLARELFARDSRKMNMLQARRICKLAHGLFELARKLEGVNQ